MVSSLHANMLFSDLSVFHIISCLCAVTNTKFSCVGFAERFLCFRLGKSTFGTREHPNTQQLNKSAVERPGRVQQKRQRCSSKSWRRADRDRVSGFGGLKAFDLLIFIGV